MEGFSTGPPISKIGHRGSNTGELIFEDCFVPEENVLGGVNKGAYVLMSGLDIERVILSAGAIGDDIEKSTGSNFDRLGLMELGLDVAMKYTSERKQFGQPIANFQLMQGICEIFIVCQSFRKTDGHVYKVHALSSRHVLLGNCISRG